MPISKAVLGTLTGMTLRLWEDAAIIVLSTSGLREALTISSSPLATGGTGTASVSLLLTLVGTGFVVSWSAASVSIESVDVTGFVVWLRAGTETGTEATEAAVAAANARAEVCPKTKGAAVAERVVVEGVLTPEVRVELPGTPGENRLPMEPIGGVTNKGRGPLPLTPVPMGRFCPVGPKRGDCPGCADGSPAPPPPTLPVEWA